jgi:hypothetical protein
MSKTPITTVSSVVNVTPEQVREQTRPSTDFKSAYFNQARVAPSFYDVRIFFGQSSVSPKGEQTFEEQFCAILSPECAKAIAEVLNTTLQKYEEVFGKFRIAPAPPKPTAQNGSSTVKAKKQ